MLKNYKFFTLLILGFIPIAMLGTTPVNGSTGFETNWLTHRNETDNLNWLTVENMNAVDNNLGRTLSSTNHVTLTHFDFEDLTGATIQGIEVKLRATYIIGRSPGDGFDLDITLLYNGYSSAAPETKETAALQASLNYYTIGSSTDNWGRAWNPEDFSNANFGVKVEAPGSSSSIAAGIDYIAVKVHYSSTGWLTHRNETDNLNWLTVENMNATDNNLGRTISSTNHVTLTHFDVEDLTGHTVQGIEVRLRATYIIGRSPGDGFDLDITAMYNGYSSAAPETKETTALQAFHSYFALGGPTDTWGRTWNPEDFSNANFGIKVEAPGASSSTAVGIDLLVVKVYSTPGAITTGSSTTSPMASQPVTSSAGIISFGNGFIIFTAISALVLIRVTFRRIMEK